MLRNLAMTALTFSVPVAVILLILSFIKSLGLFLAVAILVYVGAKLLFSLGNRPIVIKADNKSKVTVNTF
jgi:Zn-dependent membrane protease YugP